MICKTCKKELEEDANFCTTCGAKNELIITEKTPGLFQDGFFVTGLVFLIYYLLNYSLQTFVDEWYTYKSIHKIQSLTFVSFPLLLAYFAKGHVKTYLIVIGLFLIALNLFLTFVF